MLLTNHFGFGATTIASIYKDRWEIELFFKALKQNLKVKTFIGTSENALRIQIWTALAPPGGLLFDVPDGTSNSPCLHARAQAVSSSVTGSVILPGHGDDVAAEPLHLSGFASLAGRTVRNASGGSEAGTAQSEYAVTWTAVWGIWFQIRPNRAFKPLQTPKAVFDSGLFWTAVAQNAWGAAEISDLSKRRAME